MNYNIIGEPFPAVVCTLNADESMITERGSMCWMSPNMKMETTSNGGIGKVFGRMFSGEAMFQNRYTAVGGTGTIAFASSFPGSVRCFDITHPTTRSSFKRAASLQAKARLSSPSIFKSVSAQGCSAARAS